MATLPTLRGENVVLRHPRGDDLDDLYALFSDPQALRFWSHGPWTNHLQAEAYLRDIHAGAAAGSLLQWAITETDTDQLIGTVTLFRLAREHARAELGFVLHPRHWGRGLAQDAVRTSLEYAFGGLSILRVEADVDPENLASLRLLERLGFQREGLARERYRMNGSTQDSVMLGLLAREYRPRTPARTS